MTAAEVIALRRAMPSAAPKIWLALSFGCLALLAGPKLALPTFAQSLVIEILSFSLLALSLNILLGYTGLVSLGHAAFFAVAGYALAIISVNWTTEILLTLPLAVLCTALVALPLGYLSIRLSGFYFLMITFAFAQMVFVAAFHWKPLTGGSDGTLVPAATLLGHPVLDTRTPFYYFAIAMFFLCSAAMYLIVTSQFGRTLVGIRECTPRMRALGYNVRRYKLTAFVLAATFAGVAGAMNALFNLFVAPDSAHWTQSALVLVMVLIGGASYFIGPIIGAAIVLTLQHWLSSHTQYWGLILGLLFIALITGAREGIAGLVMSAFGRNGGGK
jgi:branched-chain amino acid transport system permease protein